MRPVLTAEEARGLERQTEARGTPVGSLMERAGYAVARAAAELAGGAYGHRAVVVCGKGNNAGDGFVAARYLDRWGMGVSVLLVSGEEEHREPAAANLRRLRETGVRVTAFSAAARRELGRADVAIDAVFGLGLRGAPRGPYAEAIEALERSAAPVVSVDIPSGIESDTGQAAGPAVEPAVTVTFGAPKVGNVLAAGAAASRLIVADIGYPADLLTGPRYPVTLMEETDTPLPAPRSPQAHKRDAVVLVVSGSRLMTGAPSLVARAAYRSGAGLVAIAVPEGILPTVRGEIREAVFVPLPEGPEGSAAEAAWETLAERIEGFDAVAIGPGLSTDGETPGFVRRVIRECPVPLVVDADAINAFAGGAEDLADRKANLVITPHAGELARLLGRPSDEIARDRLGAVRAASLATRAPVLLKGSPTLVAEPEGGRVAVSPSGTAVLATAGSGDVLTGMIAAFAARTGMRGMPLAAPMDRAAAGAAQVHGLAGRAAGERLGEGTTASDIADAVAGVILRLRELTS